MGLAEETYVTVNSCLEIDDKHAPYLLIEKRHSDNRPSEGLEDAQC